MGVFPLAFSCPACYRTNLRYRLIRLKQESNIFWDMAPCSWPTFRRKVTTNILLPDTCLPYFFDPEDGGRMLFLNVGHFSTGMPIITSQNVEIFVFMGMRTQGPLA
jgi:hypothetical protein